MTSNNIHKIVRRNIKTQPWMLSKNTNEIVNSCITNIYNQMPISFKNGLQQIRVSSPKEVTTAPVRNLLSHNCKQIRNSSKLIVEAKSDVLPKREKIFTDFKHDRKTVLPSSKQIAVDNITNAKKLLKAPTYKIYKNRPFASSTNSSRSSIFPYNNTYLRHSRGSIRSRTLKNSINDFRMTPRNQTMKGYKNANYNSLHTSPVIQNELMSLDKLLLKRIAVKKFQSKPKPVNTTVNNEIDPFIKWKHPPAFDQFRDTMLIDKAFNHNKGKQKQFKAEQRPNFSFNTKPKIPMLFQNRPLLGVSPGSVEDTSETSDVNNVVNGAGSTDFSTNRQMSINFLKQNPISSSFPHNSSNDQAIKQFTSGRTTNPKSTSHKPTTPSAKELHRRTRMKKLGLIKHSPQPSQTEIFDKSEYSDIENDKEITNKQTEAMKTMHTMNPMNPKTITKEELPTPPTIATTGDILRKMPFIPPNPPNNAHDLNAISSNQGVFHKNLQQSNVKSFIETNENIPLRTVKWQHSRKIDRTIKNLAPVAATMAFNATVVPFLSYRYNRSNYLNIKKY